MTPIEKVLFLQKSFNLNDRAFCSKFRIKHPLFKKWKSNIVAPEEKYLFYLCCELELDVKDFMSNESTLVKENMSKDEHLCKRHEKKHVESEVLEDFPREDNSRYEEKD